MWTQWINANIWESTWTIMGIVFRTLKPFVKNLKKIKKKKKKARRLRSFNICHTMLRMFYESAILFAVVCRSSSLMAADSNKLNKLICKPANVMEDELDSKSQ